MKPERKNAGTAAAVRNSTALCDLKKNTPANTPKKKEGQTMLHICLTYGKRNESFYLKRFQKMHEQLQGHILKWWISIERFQGNTT